MTYLSSRCDRDTVFLSYQPYEIGQPTKSQCRYANNGNITSIADNLGGTAGRTFQYDDLNRLTYGQGNFGANKTPKTCNYGYSAIGNLTNKCGAEFSYGDAMHPSAVTYNPATGRNYTYDANGNMLTRGTQTLVWDIENRVTSVSISGGGSTLMEYDYSGMRIKKNAPTGITLYPFKGYEIDPNGTISKFIKIGNESFASKKRTSGGSTTQYFYHNDHLGSVNVITDIAGTRVQLNEYDPWGGVSRTEGTIDPTHRFNGKELDPESGLYYYGGRYYDPEISRFIIPDPFVQAPGDPQSLNRYTYVRNNPQNLIDPSGYSWFSSFFKSIGKFFKNIFKNPGLFFATLAVGIVTGGVAAWAAPATWSATMTGAFAGAVGGASAGAVGAAMSGGSIWQGIVLGGFGGAVGGGVAGSIGARTAQGIIGGAAAGGAASGAMRSAISGGNFLQNVFGGALASGLLASVQLVALKGWEYARQSTDGHAEASQKHGGVYEKNSRGEVISDGTLPCMPKCSSLLYRLGLTMSP